LDTEEDRKTSEEKGWRRGRRGRQGRKKEAKRFAEWREETENENEKSCFSLWRLVPLLFGCMGASRFESAKYTDWLMSTWWI